MAKRKTKKTTEMKLLENGFKDSDGEEEYKYNEMGDLR